MPEADTLWDWIRIIRSEYLEIPGLSLTKPQARRLWGLDHDTCDALIDNMVAAKFLRRTPRDCYVRNDPASRKGSPVQPVSHHDDVEGAAIVAGDVIHAKE